MLLPAVSFTLAWLCFAPAAEGLSSVRIEETPHVVDSGGFSAEACTAMALTRLGRSATVDDVFHTARIDPALGRGAKPEELAAALPALGFERAEGIYRLAEDSTAQRAEHFASLHHDLRAGVPTMIAARGACWWSATRRSAIWWTCTTRSGPRGAAACCRAANC